MRTCHSKQKSIAKIILENADAIIHEANRTGLSREEANEVDKVDTARIVMENAQPKREKGRTGINYAKNYSFYTISRIFESE